MNENEIMEEIASVFSHPMKYNPAFQFTILQPAGVAASAS